MSSVEPRQASATAGGSLPADEIRTVLLDWYDRAGRRRLPFRETTDPWAILVAETLAQQTQAARAGAAWRSFMDRYPTPAALADATPADVLRAWRGLGYNRRAIDLQRAARTIVERHESRVPDDPAVLRQLPGVGPYTARAVAAFAYGRRVAPVDTNVRRVLGRVVGGADEPLAPREMQTLADELVDPDRPGDWSHALMDVGATRCRPDRPDCAACPLRPWCRHAAAVERLGAPRRRSAAREPAVRFETTSRWLRGRIVDRLRDGDDHGWVAIAGPIGTHDADAVAAALSALASEGLVERHPGDPRLARLPVEPLPLAEGGSGTLVAR